MMIFFVIIYFQYTIGGYCFALDLAHDKNPLGATILATKTATKQIVVQFTHNNKKVTKENHLIVTDDKKIQSYLNNKIYRGPSLINYKSFVEKYPKFQLKNN